VGIAIRDRLGYEVFGTNTHRLKTVVPALEPGSRATVTFAFPCNIGPGDYTVTAALHSGIDHLERCYDWADKYVVFKVLPETDHYYAGVARLPVRVEAAVAAAAPTDPHELLRTLFGDAPRAIRFDDGTAAWTFSGWHAVETPGGKAVRWTQQHAAFVLKAGERGALSIKLSADESQCRPGPLRLGLLVNGVEAASAEVTSPGWQTVTFALPAAVRNRMARFALHCSRTFVPADAHGTADRRELGVMVALVWSE